MSIKHRLEAFGQLASRYRSVFVHAWRERHESRQRFLNEDEAAFLPAALAIQQKPLSKTARWTGRTLMALVACAVLWACIGTIDIVVTATGKVVPSSRTRTITSVDVAVVRSLHVQEGQQVKAGDTLLELDASATDAERDKAVGDAGTSALQVARSRAMIAAVESHRAPRLTPVADATSAQWQAAESGLESQWRDFTAKLGRFDGAIAQYGHELPLVTQRASDYKQLLHDHDVSEHAWIEKEQARIDLQGQLDDARNQRAALVAQTRKEAHDALDEGAKANASSRQDARRAGEHSKFMTLVTPVDGTVQQLTVHTVGAAVPATQPLMMVVPRDTQVEVEAFLENKDIGFVIEGQAAEVKVDAYEYTKYGTIPAHVTHVSRDAIQDDKKGLIYSVKIALDQPVISVDGRPVLVTAGMSSTVEIKTGSRRIIEYILSPLAQHIHEALHER